MPFCYNCGKQFVEGDKFCTGCGYNVGRTGDTSERRQEWAGKIIKCPHCGGAINERTVVCPDCGIEITGRAAVSSVLAFKEQLMEIESHRKKDSGGMFSVYSSVDPADKQKLSLIRNFPIPNAIDDILEFMMLAIANIDVSLSKKSWANRCQSMEVFAMEMPRVISNAWVSKLQQAYQKAAILFPNEPVFKGIQNLYFDKMKELRIKV